MAIPALAALAGLLLGVACDVLWPPQFVARVLLAPAASPDEALSSDARPADRNDIAAARVASMHSPQFLRAVAARGQLDVRITPVTLPLFGTAVARRQYGNALAAPRLGLSRYAWGGEVLTVARFDIDPVHSGEHFEVRADGGDGFTLRDAAGQVLCQAQVSATVCRTTGLELVVRELVARPGTRFVLRREPPGATAALLARRIAVTPLGATGGLLAVDVRGADPAWLGRAATALADEFVLAAPASPDQRAALDELDARLRAAGDEFASAQRALEDAGDTGFGRTLADVDARERIGTIAALEVRRLQASLAGDPTLGALHGAGAEPVTPAPSAAQVSELSRRIDEQRALLFAGASSAPAVERELRLQVASEIYLLLLELREPARAALPGPGTSARVLEPARVALATPPARRRWRAAGLGALLGLALTFAALTLRARERSLMATPSRLAAWTGVPVLAVVDDLAAACDRSDAVDSSDTNDTNDTSDTSDTSDSSDSSDSSTSRLNHERGAAEALAGTATPHRNSADIGVASLLTALAIRRVALDANSPVVALTSISGGHRALARALARSMRERGAAPVIQDVTQPPSTAAAAQGGRAAQGRTAAANPPSAVLRLLPSPRTGGMAGAVADADIPVLCVCSARDGRFAVRRALRQLREHAVQPAGIVLMRQSPLPAVTVRLRKA